MPNTLVAVTVSLLQSLADVVKSLGKGPINSSDHSVNQAKTNKPTNYRQTQTQKLDNFNSSDPHHDISKTSTLDFISVRLIVSGEGRHTTHLTPQTDWRQSSDILSDISSDMSSDITSAIF